MNKKITYLFIPAIMTCSAAIAQPLPSNQVLLSSEQMDQVTAGYNASVNTSATASGANFAVTGTNAYTQVNSTPNGYDEVAAGAAVAAADGPSAKIGTNVNLSTNQPPGSHTNSATIDYVSHTLDIQVGLVATTASR
jgi:hypothetical protein